VLRAARRAETMLCGPGGYAGVLSCSSRPRPAAGTSTVEEDIVAETYNGYCVKCKEKRDFEGEVVTSDSGRRMAKGSCPVCGTKMNRILGKA
jgi:hypothetical protein